MESHDLGTFWQRGQVTVCCTTDDNVHSVVAEGDDIGIHVYGGDIGILNRPAYERSRMTTTPSNT